MRMLCIRAFIPSPPLRHVFFTSSHGHASAIMAPGKEIYDFAQKGQEGKHQHWRNQWHTPAKRHMECACYDRYESLSSCKAISF